MARDPLGPDNPQMCLDDFSAELLRWNESINLLSRKDSHARCRGLVDQCGGAWRELRPWLEDQALMSEGSFLHYIDLGSGSGFPGVIWSLELGCGDLRDPALLVEPREKRAWFLNRLNKRWGGGVWDVSRAHWGVEPLDRNPLQPRGPVLISLKALRLNDFQIMAGLFRLLDSVSNLAGGFCPVVIARFYPPDQVLDDELDKLLAGPDLGCCMPGAPWSAQFRERLILGPSKGLLPANLVVTRIDVFPA